MVNSATATVKLLVRRGLHWTMRLALRVRSRPLRSCGGNTTVIIAPHQDDETLGCGGLIALRSQRGGSTRIVYLTDGSGSHLGHPVFSPAAIATQRRIEAQAATTLLGLKPEQLTFIDARD